MAGENLLELHVDPVHPCAIPRSQHRVHLLLPWWWEARQGRAVGHRTQGSGTGMGPPLGPLRSVFGQTWLSNISWCQSQHSDAPKASGLGVNISSTYRAGDGGGWGLGFPSLSAGWGPHPMPQSFLLDGQTVAFPTLPLYSLFSFPILLCFPSAPMQTVPCSCNYLPSP